MSLQKEMEELFASSEQRVLRAFQARAAARSTLAGACGARVSYPLHPRTRAGCKVRARGDDGARAQAAAQGERAAATGGGAPLSATTSCPPPQSTNKPRVLCLTAKRRSKKRGFKGTLHICKLSGSRYQVGCTMGACRTSLCAAHTSAAPPPPLPQIRKSLPLKHLTRMEAFLDSPGRQEYLELSFSQVG